MFLFAVDENILEMSDQDIPQSPFYPYNGRVKRMFEGRSLELIAPAGTLEIYKAVIDSSCDAVYCGGQVLNMRMIRRGYNLSNDELKEAVDLANERDKKIYVTVNSLLEDGELGVAEEYLGFLEEIQPHGLIIQDTAILDFVREKGLTIPLHASVMMNVHNLDGIRFLEKQGVSRMVLSREMSLSEVRAIAAGTDMELEYFTHGDMCVAHGAQCLYSSWLFGMSGSRGRCLKPCRWPYSRPGVPDEKPYPLAVKDLSLYSHLADMILAGISSFKIEGRMRQKEFIVDLVNRYGEALDRFLADPLTGTHANPEDMEPFKKRDYSAGYAFGIPGADNINSRGEGSGKFYSTGKMFSTPTAEQEVGAAEVLDPRGPNAASVRLRMAVRVNTPAMALLALECGADRIYLSAEPFAPEIPAGLDEMRVLFTACEAAGAELFSSLPRMMRDGQTDLFRALFRKEPPVHGVLAGHGGVFELVDGGRYRIVCDTAMNIYNPRAVRFYTDRGAAGWTASLELPFDSLASLPGGIGETFGSDAASGAEVVLHGLPTVMYMDHDVSRTREGEMELTTPESRLTIRRDWWDRYHLLPHKELSLLPRLPELIAGGYRLFRLELQAYEADAAENVMRVCRAALDNPSRAAELVRTLEPVGGGFTYGAHQF